LVAAYTDKLGIVLTQLPVDAKTNEHKAALTLLKLIPLKGTLVTGDAAFAQKDFSQEVLDGGGDYFLTVKDNQPGLKQAILDAFDAPFSP
jgi:predicted transposase YbfD/YdcC